MPRLIVIELISSRFIPRVEEARSDSG